MSHTADTVCELSAFFEDDTTRRLPSNIDSGVFNLQIPEFIDASFLRIGLLITYVKLRSFYNNRYLF